MVILLLLLLLLLLADGTSSKIWSRHLHGREYDASNPSAIFTERQPVGMPNLVDFAA
jgi:hypothetical protein